MSVIAEIFEAAWQRADTLKGAIEKGYRYYSKSIFVYLAMHLGYLATIFIALRYNLLNWPIIGILAFKSLDIFFKIEMISRIYGKGRLDPQMEAMLNAPIPKWYFFSGVFVYPYFVYMAFHV